MSCALALTLVKAKGSKVNRAMAKRLNVIILNSIVIKLMVSACKVRKITTLSSLDVTECFGWGITKEKIFSTCDRWWTLVAALKGLAVLDARWVCGCDQLY